MSLAEKNLQNLHFALQCPSTRLLRLLTDIHRYKDAVRRGCALPPLVRFHLKSLAPLRVDVLCTSPLYVVPKIGWWAGPPCLHKVFKKLPMKDDHRDRGSNGPNTKYDDPPNSRLFIVCGRQITEDQFKEGFGVYGKIEEIWLVKDRVSKAPKGITYIKVMSATQCFQITY